MSSSSAVLPKQFWVNSQGFRDASDYTLFKKRQGIRQVAQEPVERSILQSLQNRTSYQFSELNCSGGCTSGGFPRNLRLTSVTPI
jgi:hypothetical protein